METASRHILDYAHGPGPRRRSRMAVSALLLLATSILLSVSLLMAAEHNLLPDCFLCCKAPGVSAAAFVGVPGATALMATVAVARIARRRDELKGLPWAIAALALALPLTALGVLLFAALKL